MQILEVLEGKVNHLVSLCTELSQQNKKMQSLHDTIKAENEELKIENAKFAEDNAQLSMQLRAVEASFEQGSEQICRLNEETTLAKSVVDDLIKTIDTFVERAR